MSIRFWHIILVGFVGYYFVMLVSSYNKLAKVRVEYQSQFTLNTKLKEQNSYLQQRVEALKSNDLSIYESFTRRQLNYYKPTEFFYRVYDDKIAPKFASEAKIPFAFKPVDRQRAVPLTFYGTNDVIKTGGVANPTKKNHLDKAKGK